MVVSYESYPTNRVNVPSNSYSLYVILTPLRFRRCFVDHEKIIMTDRNKIELAHRLSVPIFCSSLIRNPDDKKTIKYFQLFWSEKKSNPIRSDAYFPE